MKSREKNRFFILTIALFMAGSSMWLSASGTNEDGVISIDMASVYDAKSPPVLGAVKFKELLEEKSEGKITVNLFPNGSLGSEADICASLASGDIEMVLGGIQPIDMYAQRYMFISAPYLMTGWDHINAILDSEIGQNLEETMEENNMMMLSMIERGIRNTSSNQIIMTPEDMTGIKLRLPEVASWIASWKGIGATPVPVALPELYSALQTHVVEASEGQYEQLATFKLYEVQDYVVNTKHLFDPVWIYMSKSFYDSLPDEYQDMVKECADEATEYANGLAVEKDGEFLKELVDNGVEVIDPDVAAFRAAAEPVLRDLFISTWTVTTYDEISQLAN